MKPSKSFINKSLGAVKSIVLKHVPRDTKVFLFGSLANQSNALGSDIDVGFMGAQKVDDGIISQMREEIDESDDVPFHVDLVDFYGKSESFKNTALKNIVLWKQ